MLLLREQRLLVSFSIKEPVGNIAVVTLPKNCRFKIHSARYLILGAGLFVKSNHSGKIYFDLTLFYSTDYFLVRYYWAKAIKLWEIFPVSEVEGHLELDSLKQWLLDFANKILVSKSQLGSGVSIALQKVFYNNRLIAKVVKVTGVIPGDWVNVVLAVFKLAGLV